MRSSSAKFKTVYALVAAHNALLDSQVYTSKADQLGNGASARQNLLRRNMTGWDGGVVGDGWDGGDGWDSGVMGDGWDGGVGGDGMGGWDGGDGWDGGHGWTLSNPPS